MVVDEYATQEHIDTLDAFRRLFSCSAVQALEENYEIEHTLPLSSTLDAVSSLYARGKAEAV